MPSLKSYIRLVVLVGLFLPGQGFAGFSRTGRDTALLPVRTLRLAFHVFQTDSGTANFSREGKDVEFLRNLIGWANHQLAHLDTLTPAVSSPYVGDSRVRIRLDTVYYHRDSRAWDCSAEIDGEYMRERYVDNDTLQDYRQKYQTLPVFLGGNHPVAGGHTRNIGDRGYIAVRGYYPTFVSQTDAVALDECGRNLIHELGHCLGLDHNFTGGPAGDQCDVCDDNGCPQEGTSNNLMDYWPNYGRAISLCQFRIIHSHLNGERGNISEVVINDSCYRVPGPAFRIETGETLVVRDTVYAHNDWVIGSGARLEVSGYLSMPAESSIRLEQGAQLLIQGGVVGNLCGDLWAGIRVDGEPHRAGTLMLTRGGAIEHARTGILAGQPLRLRIDGGIFRNCVESVVLRNSSMDTLRISHSHFRVTNRLNHYEEGVVPEVFLRTEGVDVLQVDSCEFINEPGTFIFDADWMGTGIRSDSRQVQVSGSGFVNLTQAIWLMPTGTDSRIEVSNNQLTHNRYGVRVAGAGLLLIRENQVELQRFNLGPSVGVQLVEPVRMVVSGNRFYSRFGGGEMAGLVITRPGGETSPVFSNRFSNLPMGILADGPPVVDRSLLSWAAGEQGSEGLELGPQFRFNRYDTVGLQLALIHDSACGMAFGSFGDLPREYGLPALSWPSGGYAWYSGSPELAAFRGWKQPADPAVADHGFYAMMNKPGLAPVADRQAGLDSTSLRDYLGCLIRFERRGFEALPGDFYHALRASADIPAALRSGILASGWNRYQSEERRWMREALAKVAAGFVRGDTLLAGLGTWRAALNLDRWTAREPVRVPEDIRQNDLTDFPDFVFPSMALFRFDHFDQDEGAPPGFDLYPVPARDYLIIRPALGYATGSGWSGRILSADGRVVQLIQVDSWEEQRVDVSRLAAGVYIIELFSGIQYLGALKFTIDTH